MTRWATLYSGGIRGIFRILVEIKEADAEHWGVLMALSTFGLLGLFAMAASLKFISATMNVVTGTIEIVLAYICQGGASLQ